MFVREVGLTSSEAETLVGNMLAYLGDLYAGHTPRPLRPDQFAPPAGSFLVAELEGAPIACGGVRTCSVGPRIGELKRLWVEPDQRGRGVARQLLACLEGRAVELGFERLYLDTGPLQEAAVRLYQSSGYLPIPNYSSSGALALRAFEKVLVPKA